MLHNTATAPVRTRSLRVDAALFTAAQAPVSASGSSTVPTACASLLKPLYAWAAGPADAVLTRSACAAVRVSDNDATTGMIGGAGGLGVVLDRLGDLSGVRWETASSWGQVEVRATEVAAAYRAMAACGSPRSRAVLGQMLAVPREQTLGCDVWWANLRGVGRPMVAAKCGWDLGAGQVLRTHVVVMDADAGAVVLTEQQVDNATAARWRTALAAGGPEAVLPLHRSMAWPAVYDALSDATALTGQGS